MILLVALTTATLVPYDQQPATASCAAPHLAFTDDVVLLRGTTVEIDGTGFANGCDDVGSCTATLGCTSCDNGPEPTPMRDITLSLRQDGRTWPLDTADARATHDHFGRVTWAVQIPTDAARGRATLAPDQGQPVKVRIR